MKKTLLLHVCCAVCAAGSIYRLLDYDFNIVLIYYNPNIFPFEEFLLRLNEVFVVSKYFKIPLFLLMDNRIFKINEKIINDNKDNIILYNEIKHGYSFDKLKRLEFNEGFKKLYKYWLNEHMVFLNRIKGLEKLPENSLRCIKCFDMRLKAMFELTKVFDKVFEYFDLVSLEKSSLSKVSERYFSLFEEEIRRIKGNDKNNDILFTTTLSISPYKDSNKIFKLTEKYDNFFRIDFKKKNGFLYSKKIARLLNLYDQNYCGCEFSIDQ